MDKWCGGNLVRKDLLTSNHECWAFHIDFEIQLRQLVAGRLSLYVGRFNAELFSIPPWHCGEFYVMGPDWWAEYESYCRLYAPTPLVIAYCSAVCKGCCNDRDRVISIAETENLIMFPVSFSAAYEHG